MAKVSKFLSSYVKVKDVKNPITVTITAVEPVTFTQDGEEPREALVLHAKELEQGVVLSKAAINQLVEITGADDTDSWIAKRVTLFVDPNVTYKGKRVGGLRFRAPNLQD